MKNKKEKTNKKFTILGMSIWRVLAYFIIYSILGYLIETLFGLVTKGVIESRQSFLYGPFCAIYELLYLFFLLTKLILYLPFY